MAPGVKPAVARCGGCGCVCVTWQTPAVSFGVAQRWCVACIRKTGWVALLRYLRAA